MKSSKIRLQTVRGGAINTYLEEVARLRITVFREFPYLYDGNLNYEKSYLQTYVKCQEALLVLALLDEQVVGASTAIPMIHEEDNFKAPFAERGFDLGKIFYCAESVLLPEYRGQGVGVKFFQEREVHARALGGFDYMTFCAVVRAANHPLRPTAYQPLDEFWGKRGFRKQAGITASYSWKDVDNEHETSKRLEFWLKSLVQEN